MGGKGWRAEYGISDEGKHILGFVEALPTEARTELVAMVEMLCRSQGYFSLHDDVGGLTSAEPANADASLARVIPIARQRPD